MRVLLTAVIILFGASVASGQALRGHIEDAQSERIPFATLYVKELRQGVTSNANGEFELAAPVGTYTCLFRCLGYEMLTDTVALTSSGASLRIVLQEKVYELPSARISATDEDPAYAIMRRAISRAPYYRQAVKEYVADVYTKGLLKIDAIKGLAGLAVGRKAGKALANSGGVMESVSEVRFTAPDRYEHRIKSAQQAVSFDTDEIKMPELKAGMMLVDIYGSEMELLSPRAFSHYRFRYEGDFLEGDLRINKIKVTPRSRRKDLFSGYLYIVEDRWNVYSLDLSSVAMGINLRLEQQYGEMSDGLYLPVSSRAEWDGSIIGVKLSGHYNTSIKYSSITPNDKLSPPPMATTEPVAAPPPSSKQARIEQQLADIAAKDRLTTRDMRRAARMQQELADMATDALRADRGEKKSLEVTSRYTFSEDSAARRRDTAYWNTMRPIPLVRDELAIFHKNDSLRRSAAPRDTSNAGKRRRPANWPGALAYGRTFRIDSTLSVTYDGLLGFSNGQFNTVDGFVVGQSGSLVKRLHDDRRLTLRASAGYAFSRHTVLWNAGLTHRYGPSRRASWSLDVGRRTEDYAGDNGVGSVGALASLLFRVNYPMFYDKRYLYLRHTTDLANGLQLSSSVAYTDNRQETNHSDYSVFFTGSRDYRPNRPRHAGLENNPVWRGHTVDFLTDVALSFTPQYYYRMDGLRKQMLYSRYPTFGLRWQRAWNGVMGSSARFDFIEASIAQHIRLHPEASVDYRIEAGVFPRPRAMGFHSFRHFYTNEAGLLLSAGDRRPLQLLPGYTYSTNQWFVRAQAEYQSFFLLIKRLPFLSNNLMSERLSVALLQTPALRPYTEWGYSLTEIYLIGRAGVFVGFDGLRYYGWGLRAAITIGD
jgi:hypothetical protein